MQRFSILFTIILILTFSSPLPLSAASNSVIISEVLYDPSGPDLGYEWIELYNPTQNNISLEGWKIEVAGTKFQTAATLSGNIPAKSLFLVCEMNVEGCNLKVNKLGFQNGGGATDGIQIVDNSNTII